MDSSAIPDVGYPVVVHRIDGFMTVHSASFDAVRAALPSDELHPARLPNGRALVAIALFQKRAVTAGSGAGTVVLPPYAELPISAIVTRRPLSRITVVLALAGLAHPPLGGFALQFPVTSRPWRDAIRSTTGIPAFVADFDLDLGDPTAWRLRVSEDGRDIVTVSVRPRGRVRELRQDQTVYGALDGRLMASRGETAFVGQQRRGGAVLRLGGEHPVAAALRSLDVSPRAIGTYVYHTGSATLEAPAATGPARLLPRHEGLDVPVGRYAVRYPGTPPIDQRTELDLSLDPLRPAS